MFGFDAWKERWFVYDSPEASPEGNDNAVPAGPSRWFGPVFDGLSNLRDEVGDHLATHGFGEAMATEGNDGEAPPAAEEGDGEEPDNPPTDDGADVVDKPIEEDEADPSKKGFPTLADALKNDTEYPAAYRKRLAAAVNAGIVPPKGLGWRPGGRLKPFVVRMQIWFRDTGYKRGLGRYGVSLDGVDGLYGPRTDKVARLFKAGGAKERPTELAPELKETPLALKRKFDAQYAQAVERLEKIIDIVEADGSIIREFYPEATAIADSLMERLEDLESSIEKDYDAETVDTGFMELNRQELARITGDIAVLERRVDNPAAYLSKSPEAMSDDELLSEEIDEREEVEDDRGQRIEALQDYAKQLRLSEYEKLLREKLTDNYFKEAIQFLDPYEQVSPQASELSRQAVSLMAGRGDWLYHLDKLSTHIIQGNINNDADFNLYRDRIDELAAEGRSLVADAEAFVKEFGKFHAAAVLESDVEQNDDLKDLRQSLNHVIEPVQKRWPIKTSLKADVEKLRSAKGKDFALRLKEVEDSRSRVFTKYEKLLKEINDDPYARYDESIQIDLYDSINKLAKLALEAKADADSFVQDYDEWVEERSSWPF